MNPLKPNRLVWFDNQVRSEGFTLLAGIDESGRGPLAGPVLAAAVILPFDWNHEEINDSKKITANKRNELYDIIQKNALSISIGNISEKIIDKINILESTRLAMKQAVNGLSIKPDCLLIDALRLFDYPLFQKSIIKGDGTSLSIAAASIIAKVTRDRLMQEYDILYPQYGFAKHKGYPTKAHYDAINKYGCCPIHRESFINTPKVLFSV